MKRSEFTAFFDFFNHLGIHLLAFAKVFASVSHPVTYCINVGERFKDSLRYEWLWAYAICICRDL